MMTAEVTDRPPSESLHGSHFSQTGSATAGNTASCINRDTPVGDASLKETARMKSNTDDELAVFREYIKRKQLRNTSEREIILREIMTQTQHFDVDNLYLQLHAQQHKVSRASIYRTIPLLLECGLIQEAFYEQGHIVYEHIFGQGHHCHMRCLACGLVVEYSLEELRRVERKLGEHYNFAVIGHRLEVYGYCPQCRSKER
jgi:Fur family ferric uptake transcriptional regulator